jgi:hypothetical protein
MASVVFTQEPVTRALLTEALPLLAEHWGEVAHYQDIPLNVDVDGYLAAAESIRCYTVRGPANEYHIRTRERGQWCLAANELVGYALFFVRANLHYSQSVQAVQDVVYLHPSVRGGTGARFLAYCDAQLTAEGVQVVYHHAKHAHPQLATALSRLGYTPVETIYGKRLDVAQETVAQSTMAPASADTSLSSAAPFQPSPWNADDETNDLARTTRGTDLTDLTDFADLMRQASGMATICDEDGG